MTTNTKAKRRSLKDCLKVILQPRRDNHDDQPINLNFKPPDTRDPSLKLLPSFSSVSLLPNFQSSRFDINDAALTTPPALEAYRYQNASEDRLTIRRAPASATDFDRAYDLQSQLSQLAGFVDNEPRRSQHIGSRNLYSPRCLTPVPETYRTNSPDNVERIVVSKPVDFDSPLSRLAKACSVPSIYRHGASQQASLVTMTSLTSNSSTLRLQKSTQTLHVSLSPEKDSAEGPSGPEKHAHSRSHIALSMNTDLTRQQRSAVKKTSLASILSVASRHTRSRSPQFHAQRPSEVEIGLSCVNHFATFCVLDASSPECRITAMSDDLRDGLSVGDPFCLDPKGVGNVPMDTVTGLDINGKEVVHLVLYSQLVNPNSGRSRFVLASLLDITEFIKDTATLPELDTVSEDSIIDEDLMTPRKMSNVFSPMYELSAEDLLKGCFLPEINPHTPVARKESDIWLDIASEESTNPRRARSVRGISTPTSDVTTTSSTPSVQNILDEFLVSLQELYADFFVLGTSPFDENAYEICNVSPRVHAAREYVEGHLNKTPKADLYRLEKKLTEEKSFCLRVRWGSAGEPKQLYCVPLYARRNITWGCFLVDSEKWASILPTWS